MIRGSNDVRIPYPYPESAVSAFSVSVSTNCWAHVGNSSSSSVSFEIVHVGFPIFLCPYKGSSLFFP